MYTAPVRLTSPNSSFDLVLPRSAKIDSPAYSPVAGGLARNSPPSSSRNLAPSSLSHGAG